MNINIVDKSERVVKKFKDLQIGECFYKGNDEILFMVIPCITDKDTEIKEDI